MRLARDAERAGRETLLYAEKLETARADQRKGQVKAGVEALIWNEAERLDDPDELKDTLVELLDSEIQDPETFLSESLDAHIARIAGCMGLASPPPCGEGAGGGGVGAEPAPAHAGPQDSPATLRQHPHPNPSPQGGGAVVADPRRPDRPPPIPDHPFRSSG
jgi:hypothetical protein